MKRSSILRLMIQMADMCYASTRNDPLLTGETVKSRNRETEFWVRLWKRLLEVDASGRVS